MNRAYAFAAGIVTAGVAASLFAGNPNPPAGPIGPTMVSLEHIAERLEAQSQLLQPKEWSSKVVGPSATVVVRTGGALVHKVGVSGSTYGQAMIFDAASTSDRSTPIAVLNVSGGNDGTLNAEIELSVRVTKGIMVEGASNGWTTVLYGD